MIKIPPFFKEKEVFDIDISLRKSIVAADYVKKKFRYITIPAFSFENVWKGSSEIIRKYYYTLNKNFTILKLPEPSGNFCPVVSWKANNTVIRYKLWSNVDEILYVPLYSGQVINKNFYLEIWTTPNVTIENTVNIFNISRFTIPSSLCDNSSIEEGINIPCNDMILNTLNDFDPQNNDYYDVINLCLDTELIHGEDIPEPVGIGNLISYLEDTETVNIENIGIYSLEEPYTNLNIEDPTYESAEAINTRAIGNNEAINFRATIDLIAETEITVHIKASWSRYELFSSIEFGEAIIDIGPISTRKLYIDGIEQVITYNAETTLYEFETDVVIPVDGEVQLIWLLDIGLVGFENFSFPNIYINNGVVTTIL